MSDVVIVGAGLSGLTAARTVLEAGRSVVVFDKGRGVGGRLATRRIGDATLDHGAQFFTVRGDAFRALVDSAVDAGIVDEWCRGFDQQDSYPRYRCPAGMSSLAKWLTKGIVDSGGVVETQSLVRSISSTEDGWAVERDSGERVMAADVVVTAPVPQTMALLDAGGVMLDPMIDTKLRQIAYKPTLALLVTLDGAPNIPEPGAVQQSEDDLFTFIADNRRKGVSDSNAVTFHVNGSVSTDRFDDDNDVLRAELIEAARPWLGTSSVVAAQLKKWRYAGPLVLHPEPCVMARSEPGRLLLAGDAFAGPKVEGAFNSGRAAGLVVSS